MNNNDLIFKEVDKYARKKLRKQIKIRVGQINAQNV